MLLQGILSGIKGILEEGLKTENPEVLKAHMGSAISMLEGILKGYAPITVLKSQPGIQEGPIDEAAQSAENELR